MERKPPITSLPILIIVSLLIRQMATFGYVRVGLPLNKADDDI